MKRALVLLLVTLCLLTLTACEKLSSNDTVTFPVEGMLVYNDNIYIQYSNTNGKFDADIEGQDSVKIATRPFGFFYILGAVTEYYANDSENPEYIFAPRGYCFYVRNDLTIDHNSLLTVYNNEESYSFKINDVILEEKIEFEVYDNNRLNSNSPFEEVRVLEAWIEPDKFAFLNINIIKQADKYYLQDSWDSDLYLLKEEFTNQIIDIFNDEIKTDVS